MIIELHILQNLAPANVNRDDTGAPKECEFGGISRARVSSQSWKRAIRDGFRNQLLIDPEFVGKRTMRVVEAISRIVSQQHEEDESNLVVSALLTNVLKLDEKGTMKYLVLFSQQGLKATAELCLQHWDVLLEFAIDEAQKKTNKQNKGSSAKFPINLKNAFDLLLNGYGAADLALFGRMIADYPNKNVEASSQIAHAISTNALSREMDYFTAIDDLKANDESGASMIGTVEFNSACFYRYANVNTSQLTENLGSDIELAAKTLRAFLQGMVTTIPSGKQNSMAAQNPPSFVMAVIRDIGTWSLANAFVKPIAANKHHDLVAGSILALDRYWGKLTKMYGTTRIQQVLVATVEEVELANLAPHVVETCDAIYDTVIQKAYAKEA